MTDLNDPTHALRLGVEPTTLPGWFAAVPELLWVREPGTGRVIYCNRAYERLWGRPLAHLARDPQAWITAVHEDERPMLETALNQLGEDKAFDQQYRVVRPDGSTRWMEDRAWAVRDPSGGGLKLVGSARDITGQKQMESALQAAFDALNSSVSGVIITDRQGRITYVNPSFLSLFGYPSEGAVIGRKTESLFGPGTIEELSSGGVEAAKEGGRTREFKVARADGSELVVEVMASPVHDTRSQPTGVMASFVGITERKRLEEEIQQDRQRLRWLTERLAQSEEQERRRLSSQLHDTAVQSLSLAHIKLGSARSALLGDGARGALQPLEAARSLVAQGIAECRLILAHLLPPLLYEIGLGAALVELAEQLHSLHHATIEIQEEDRTQAVPESLRGPLFQTVRELLLNACKHASASKIQVRWNHSPDQFELVVADNGIGFNPGTQGPRSPSPNSGGFGLFSIRERMRALDGHFEIESRPGHGTTIRISLPRESPRPSTSIPA